MEIPSNIFRDSSVVLELWGFDIPKCSASLQRERKYTSLGYAALLIRVHKATMNLYLFLPRQWNLITLHYTERLLGQGLFKTHFWKQIDNNRTLKVCGRCIFILFFNVLYAPGVHIKNVFPSFIIPANESTCAGRMCLLSLLRCLIQPEVMFATTRGVAKDVTRTGAAHVLPKCLVVPVTDTNPIYMYWLWLLL